MRIFQTCGKTMIIPNNDNRWEIVNPEKADAAIAAFNYYLMSSVMENHYKAKGYIWLSDKYTSPLDAFVNEIKPRFAGLGILANNAPVGTKDALYRMSNEPYFE